PWAPTWMRASSQSTSWPFIQILSVACTTALLFAGSWTWMLPAQHEVERSRAGQALQLGRLERCHVGLGARADPHLVVLEQRVLHHDVRDRPLRERRDRSRLETRGVQHLVGPGDARLLRADRRGDLLLVGAPVARHEREHIGAVADE